ICSTPSPPRRSSDRAIEEHCPCAGFRTLAIDDACCRTIRNVWSTFEATALTIRNSAPLKVALAGAGMISWYHLVAWRNLGERVRVVAVCDPDRARASSRAKEFSIPKIYGDAEAMFAAEAIDALDV